MNSDNYSHWREKVDKILPNRTQEKVWKMMDY